MGSECSSTSRSDLPPPEMPIGKPQSRKAARKARHKAIKMELLSREEWRIMRTWTWEVATSKPSRYSSPNIGPRGEILPSFDIVSTGYQGLPRELAQQLKDMIPNNARYFEHIYRNEMGKVLAGGGTDKTPEEVFQEAVNEFFADEDSSDSSSDDDVSSEEFYDAECCEEHSSKEWPRCEGTTSAEASKWPKWESSSEYSTTSEGSISSEDSKVLKWNEQQLEVAERAPAELVMKLDSLDLNPPSPYQEGNTVVTVTEYIESAPYLPSDLPSEARGYGFSAHQEAILVCP